MSMNFAELVLYLLPGFLGLWVHKRIVQEDIDSRGESTQIAIGLLLGMCGIGLLFLLHEMLETISAYLPNVHDVAVYVSPASLRLVDDGGYLSMVQDVKFWSAYVMLSVLCLLSGTLSGYMCETGRSLTMLLANTVNRALKHPTKTSSESELRRVVNIAKQKYARVLVRIYPFGGDVTTGEVGMFEGYSDRSHEISLDSCYLFASVQDVHEHLKHQPSCRCVNYETGVVVEIFDWTGERIEKFVDYARSEYRKAVHPPVLES